MRIIADLHIHSRYSRSCSPALTLPNIAEACDRKGIGLVATGDFTHPAWFKDIKELLIEENPGIYKLGKSPAKASFIINSEISCIYSQGGKTRRVHILLFVPSIATAEKVISELEKRGCNLRSDGRPIIGLSAKALAQLAWDIDDKCMIIPAHIWTPWFAIFGSKSGFDSLKECFEELAPRVTAVETGPSSDPPMNRSLSALDDVTLISNSDSHSLGRMGREANVFELEKKFDYDDISRIMQGKDKEKFLFTVEMYPEEGRYYYDGHGDCKFSCLPEKSRELEGRCPVCSKPLILGTLNRVSQLADRKQDKSVPGFKYLVPLLDTLSASLGVGMSSKKVSRMYEEMTTSHTEFEILLDLSESEIAAVSNAEITRSIMAMRNGEVDLQPGYDGVYGKVSIKSLENKKSKKQEKLF